MKQNFYLLSMKRKSENDSAPSYTRSLSSVSSDLRNSSDEAKDCFCLVLWEKNPNSRFRRFCCLTANSYNRQSPLCTPREPSAIPPTPDLKYVCLASFKCRTQISEEVNMERHYTA